MKNLPINLLSYNLNDADELQLQHQLLHLTYLQLYRNLNYFYQVCKYLLIIVKRHQIASLRLHKYIDLLLLSSSLLKCILKLHFQFSKQQYNCYMLVQSVRQMYLVCYVGKYLLLFTCNRYYALDFMCVLVLFLSRHILLTGLSDLH